MKKEVAAKVVNKTGRNVKFTVEEDRFLKAGIDKHGKAWSLILKENKSNFHTSRTRDTLRMRAESIAFKNTIKRST